MANPTIGHTASLISIGAQLIKNGNEILFIIPGIPNKKIRAILNRVELTIPDKLEEKNIPYKTIPLSIIQGYLGLSLDKKRGREETMFALKIFSAGAKKYLKAIEKELRTFKPDAIIYDYTFFPAIAISEKHHIPRIANYTSGLPFYEYPIPDIGSTYRYGNYPREKFEENFNETKRIEGIIKTKYENLINKKIDSSLLSNPSSTFLNIITTIKEAEYPRYNLDETVYFAGPCLPEMTPDKPLPSRQIGGPSIPKCMLSCQSIV